MSKRRATTESARSFRLVELLGVAAVVGGFFVLFVNPTTFKKSSSAEEIVEVDLKALGNFPFDPERDTIDAVPQRFRNLDGKRVRLFGEMYSASVAAPSVDSFQLVYTLRPTFGSPPRVQERVFASMPAGKSAPYYAGYVRVVGTLHVGQKTKDGQTASLYTMDVESINPMAE